MELSKRAVSVGAEARGVVWSPARLVRRLAIATDGPARVRNPAHACGLTRFENSVLPHGIADLLFAGSLADFSATPRH